MKALLAEGVEALGLSGQLGSAGLDQLGSYLDLLEQWNRAYNLTAVRDREQMVSRHLLDSLAIGPFLGSATRCIDVGTGAGLPGIPLAILYPERGFQLLDGNGKKTRFLFQVKTALGLDNIGIHQARVEHFEPTAAFEVVLTRAFASLADMVESCRHLCADDGRFLAMKGRYPGQELEALGQRCRLGGAHPISVPGLQEQRHLIELYPAPGVDEGILG